MDIRKLSIKEIREILDTKKISTTELVTYYYDQIKKINPKINALITLDEEQAYKQASIADKKISSKTQTFLTGIPIIHKDNLCSLGTRTSAGSKMLDNFISPYNATAISNCKNAGTIMLGKSNMDEFSMGSSNKTSYYGVVKNPWNVTRVPGGSSGGSAAAVAAGLAPFATGSDTGGSIRQPSAFCGVTGLKPTYGTISRYGLIAFASSLDQIGVIAKSAKDCSYLLEEMTCYDPNDSTSINKQYPKYSQMLNSSIKGKKIGFPIELFDRLKDEKIKSAINKAIETYKTLGAEIIEVSLPNCIEYSVATYYLIATAEASTNLSRYDGVRYGYRCDNPKSISDLYIRSRSESFGSEVKRRIMLGTFALSSGYYDDYYTKAQKIRSLICSEFDKVFKEIDLIITPTTPEMPGLLSDNTTKPTDIYLADIYTTPANLAGLPAMSIPVGHSEELPIGMQLIGPSFSEQLLLNVAHAYQEATDFHKINPKI